MDDTYLGRIIAAHRAAAETDDRPLDVLIERAGEGDPPRPFRRALAAVDGVAVISEIKRRSPSRGDLYAYLDPAALAVAYEDGGATCLSVLTDADWFGGSDSDLRAARSATSRPVLRKDFTVDARDVADARLMGADCVLLIAAALDDTELRDFHQLAAALRLDALVEIHDDDELERALAVDATLIGVNQRDLFTFEVDRDRAARLAARIPSSVVRVAESGIRDHDDMVALGEAGYDAALIGESLVVAGDPAEAVRNLRGG